MNASFAKLTVLDLKQHLEEFDECLSLVYAKDDEGNQFNKITQFPSAMLVKKQESHRFLEIRSKMTKHSERCVCINGGGEFVEGMTVGDLKKALDEYDPNLSLIYSHDDEGNEFQYVLNSPSILYVKKQTSPRDLSVQNEKKPRAEKCVCVN
jgi:hypothetical protein